MSTEGSRFDPGLNHFFLGVSFTVLVMATMMVVYYSFLGKVTRNSSLLGVWFGRLAL
jgi:hypothetical protein